MISFDAWADESYSYAQRFGVYVVAAVTFSESELAAARAAMTELRGGHPRGKLHWVRMEPTERAKAARQVADLGGFHIVVVCTAVPPRKEERARAICLTSIVQETYGFGRRALCAEARQPVLDNRDVRLVRSVRNHLPVGARFFISHVPGEDEPLLWAADIVAGAVRAARQGEDATARESLSDVIYEVEVPYRG